MTSANPVALPLLHCAEQQDRGRGRGGGSALVMETEDFVRADRAFADKGKPVFEGN